MTKPYDAIIIGAGHNGLVTAGLLAKVGQRVLVLEQRDKPGGVATTEEIFPGFKFNTGGADAGMFRPEVVEALNLTQYGLEFLDSPAVAFAPQPDGPGLTLWRDVQKSQAEIARFSESDAETFPAFVQAVSDMTQRLDGLMTRTPPNLTPDQLDQLLPWLGDSLGLRPLSYDHFNHFLRVLALSATEFLDEWFESDALKGLLGTAGVAGAMQGPKAPYTAAIMLYHYLGGGTATGFRASRFVRGGIGQLSGALASAARAQGVEIQTGAKVAGIIIDDNRAAGVTLAGGEQIPASAIISNADPRRTFFELVAPTWLDVRFVRRVKNIRFKGCTAKVNLALNDLPAFTSLGPQSSAPLTGHILICPGLDYLERAYDDAKYGRFSRQPYLDVVIPTALEPALAPAGQHIMSITMQYAPYHLREGNWDEQREALGDRIIDTLAEYAPNLKASILHRQVITPLDFERDYGLTEGSIYHGQMDLSQMLFMRPLPGYSQYRAPIQNLYLCGAGTHPGGGLTGAPGLNAAREVLKDLQGTSD